jgi:hypothetical protein
VRLCKFLTGAARIFSLQTDFQRFFMYPEDGDSVAQGKLFLDAVTATTASTPPAERSGRRFFAGALRDGFPEPVRR